MRHVNRETEAAVLGVLLDAEGPLVRSSATKLLATSGLGAEDFLTPAHRTYLIAIAALAERGRPADAASVWALVKGRPGVPDDGYSRLAALQGQNTVTAEGFATMAQALRRLCGLRQLEAFHRRQLEKVSVVSADLAGAAMDLAGFAQSFVGAGEEFHTGEVDHAELAEEWEAHLTGQRPGGLPIGVDALDHAIGGWAENLNVLGGASSVGKSSLIAQAIWTALQGGHRVALFGLEDGTRWVAKRYVASAMGMPLRDVGRRVLSEGGRTRLWEVQNQLASVQARQFCWRPRAGERLSSARLVELCKKAIHQHRVRALFIDHGLEIDYVGEKGEELRHRIDRTFGQLRSLAVASHTPIVVVVHFNREGAKREGPPRQEDFAECAGIERMSRLSLGLWSSEEDSEDEVRCTVLKNTEGKRRLHFLLKRNVEAALVLQDGGRVIEPGEGRAGKPLPWKGAGAV